MFSLLSLIIAFVQWFQDAQQWMQMGAVIALFCLILCLYRPARRPAFITFVLLGLGLCTWNYLKTEYDSFKPLGSEVAAKKKWLR